MGRIKYWRYEGYYSSTRMRVWRNEKTGVVLRVKPVPCIGYNIHERGGICSWKVELIADRSNPPVEIHEASRLENAIKKARRWMKQHPYG